MNAFEKLEKFDEQSIQQIAFNMVKWFMFDQVTIKTETRGNVESTVWITVIIEWGDGAHKMYIDGQRNDIVHRRLSEWLRTHLEKQRRAN
jgi:hypothetical protein